jgi:hypothetical protein
VPAKILAVGFMAENCGEDRKHTISAERVSCFQPKNLDIFCAYRSAVAVMLAAADFVCTVSLFTGRLML